MRASWPLLGAVLGVFACSSHEVKSSAPTAPVVTEQRILYTDGLHNENTDLLALDDRILLAFRGGESGQVGTGQAHIEIFASFDGGGSFQRQSEVDASALPDMRDIRDPKLIEFGGKLLLYAISRLPGAHYRDLLGDAWTVRAESTDRGVTWSEPVKTLTDMDENGEHFWGLWGFTERSAAAGNTLYALGYDDGDDSVALFQTSDGESFQKQAVLIDDYDDVPSEAELQFFGAESETAVALVRLDDQGILENGQTAICTAKVPFDSWECGRRLEQRFDGARWISPALAGTRRNFVAARKHLPCTFKRTALYELAGDLSDPNADVRVCELEQLTSAGDTAYAGFAPLADERWLLSWYSNTVPSSGDIPWLAGTSEPSDIWLANVDLSQAPSDRCTPAAADEACPLGALPLGDAASASAGDFLVTIAPVFIPKSPLSLRVTLTASADGSGAFDWSVVPLDASTLTPVSDAWLAPAVPVAADGSFSVPLGTRSLPVKAFPTLADPFLQLRDLSLNGVFLADSPAFCGNLLGHAQVVGSSPSDVIDLTGSTFGAVAIDGATLPSAVVSCPE